MLTMRRYLWGGALAALGSVGACRGSGNETAVTGTTTAGAPQGGAGQGGAGQGGAGQGGAGQGGAGQGGAGQGGAGQGGAAQGGAGQGGAGQGGVVDLCGNGQVDIGEACDDGDTVDTDDCTNACTLPICGDGVVQQGEVCDDAGAEGGCSPECSICGDGIVGDDEPCDDGNVDNLDACTAACTCNTYAGIPSSNNGNVAAFAHIWAYSGFVGINAGLVLCAQNFNNSHVCTYEELMHALDTGELSTDGTAGDGSRLYQALQGADTNQPSVAAPPYSYAPAPTVWIHRLTEVTVDGTSYATNEYHRCSDWTGGPPGANGEYALVNPDGPLTVFLDPNPCAQSSCFNPAIPCTVQRRSAIPCCYDPSVCSNPPETGQ